MGKPAIGQAIAYEIGTIGMERVFGEGSCYVLSIRPVGGVQIDL